MVGSKDCSAGCPVLAVRDRVAAATGGRIDGDDVGAAGQLGAAGQAGAAGDAQVAVVFGEDGQPAAFRGHVKPAAARVEGELGS